MAALLRPSQISGLNRQAFTEALAGVYEHSDWVADQAWSLRPFSSRENLLAALNQVMLGASTAQQTRLIRAHPELAGQAAQSGTLSPASTQEQSQAGLIDLEQAGQARMQSLNRQYREKFGFPFIIAVQGRDAAGIEAELRMRLQETPEQEFATALQQIALIAAFRLAKRVASEG
ncbi:2-oxo-4-hydroxy-4-carboxy-5-ureidoimidazoline decarboxylase [Crenobacter intestini]|uniref:2-oxo-4-hydroxy-4-carboxy-5-ureidoimidazoline decarboxylase n=1 Tax=Crenobacter intestini TaxID=2563443 RepID=A0A4T0V6N4_9NEIS|nr:2-oxo-4-hydroxy-4-carboxy-5-ureidoimidazoline decarboxylase [Crenobacter intestini]TIC87121.1 2-oxo-4-hydroxy-4-carboxy-5-ureidoimidazoline decarboxylase [Crenobacter intestini]